MMQPGFAGSCPTCGCQPTWQGAMAQPQQWMGGFGPASAGFAPPWAGMTGFPGAWGAGVGPGFGGQWGAGPQWMGAFAPGMAAATGIPTATAGYGLGGLRRWGGAYTPQYTSTGLPTDEEITEMVYDAIDDDPMIPWDADINVDVDAGEVRLTGTVPNKRIKHAAGDDAWWIPGVTDVHNEIQVTGRHRGRQEAPGEQPAGRRRGAAVSAGG